MWRSARVRSAHCSAAECRVGSSQVFQYIEKQALEEKDERTHLTCLDILSSKVFPVAHELLQRDIASTNSKVRYAALKIYARNPQKESEGILLEAMNSSELESRQEASYGLGLFSSELSLVALKKALGDPCMPVRLQSAKSLKKIGSKGIEILHQQKGQGDHLTSEIANYVLEFS